MTHVDVPYDTYVGPIRAALAAERLDWHGSLADGSDPIGKWYEVILSPRRGERPGAYGRDRKEA